MIRATPLIRTSLVLGLALACAPEGRAAEGGAIRSGEHDGFSRIVLRVDAKTEWSLETSQGRAAIVFPGKALDFGTKGVFEKMPRTRIREINSTRTEAGTRVDITLGCEACRVDATVVEGRYLALDVTDQEAPPQPVAVAEDPVARDKRETSAVASAEQVLIQQIERAASQGLIELSDPAAGKGAEKPAVPARDHPVAEAESEQPAPPPLPRQVAAPATPAPIGLAARPETALPDLFDHDQIQATTVFDRDGRRAAARMAIPPVAPECLPDSALDLPNWSQGQALFDEAPKLDARLVGEFDRPDPKALTDLARLYIRFGFGMEAESLLAGFDIDLPDRALLLDLARAVEARPISSTGPLSVRAACPGRHALWLAIGGVAPVFQDEATFATVQTAFAELPPDLRVLLGPRLITRLLDAGHPAEARSLYETTARSAEMASADLLLAEALLRAGEGDAAGGAAALRDLIASNPPNAVEALSRLARLDLDANLPSDPTMVTDLRAAALESRGGAGEAALRGLLVETLARDGDLTSAIAELRAARADLPASEERFDRLRAEILAAADPTATGAAAYAEVILAEAPLLGLGPETDAGRHAIALRLLDLGLPRNSLDILAPALGRGLPEARMVAAEAQLRLDQPEAAQALLDGLDTPEAAALRARILARTGDFSGAARTLDAAGMASSALDYAWPSGDWKTVDTVSEDSRRRAMASYMASRTGGTRAPSAEPAKLDPEQAFQEPLPRLDRASLDSARRLLATGRQVGGFVQDLLQPPKP